MFCPNYRNREVFDWFNQMVEAFGGRPLTEEEFRSADLREQRSGDDYRAMEAAYRTYHRNAGNFLDKAPNGEPSILFKTLLDHFDGDIQKAIVAKSNVYSDEFFNWFGDWTQNDETEPLVKYYGATMGKTTAAKTNSRLVDFDDIVRDAIKAEADRQGVTVRELKMQSGEEYRRLLLDAINEWRNNPDNNGKTLVVSNAAMAKEPIFDNVPSLPSKEEFVKRQVARGEGDIKAAEQYYDDLVSKWMPRGFKTDNRFVSDIESISEITDQNGEPVVVYHNTRSQFDKFDKKYIRTADGFFFTVSNTPLTALGNIQIPVYLNVKRLKETDSIMPTGDDFAYQSDGFDGMSYFFMDSESFIIPNPNQIKHVENLGTFNPEEDNMYYAPDVEEKQDKLTTELGLGNKFKRASITQLFGPKLMSGETVSSRELLMTCLSQQTFSNSNMNLAELLSKHDIPVRVEILQSGKLMATRTFSDGSTVILINPNHSSRVSNRRLSDSLLHEVIHAITVNAINNPKTEEERKFARANRDMFQTFDKLFPPEIFSRNDMDTGYYILKNEKEFAAVFATDINARQRIYAKAIEEDKKHHGRFLRLIKRFINAFARAVANKNVFKDVKQDELLRYQNIARKYLLNRKAIVKGNISRADLFKAVYNNMDDDAVNGDGVSDAIESMSLQSYEENAAVDVMDQYRSTTAPAEVYVTNEEQAKKRLKIVRGDVVEGLVKRLQAVRASTLPDDYKTQQEQIIQSHIQMFKSETMSDFIALSNLVSQILPTLNKDRDRLNRIQQDDNYVISATDYMYQMHSNFGTYKKILEGIKDALKFDVMQEYLRQQFETDSNNQLSIRYTMDLLNNSVNDAITTIDDGIRILNDLLIRTVYEDLRDIGIDTHSPDMVEYLQELRKIGYDTSGFSKTFGSADRAKDNGLRAIAYLTNKANRAADSRTVSRAASLLKLKDALKSGESELDLYELDDEGLTTGYLVRKVNFGLFLKDYNAEIRRINKLINDKYKLTLDPDNRLAPDDPDARKEWNDLRNKWLGENAERKFKKEYYEAFSKLSEITRQRRNEIQRQIAALKTEALGPDGYYHYENLTSQQWKTLQGLYIQKRILVSDYDANGNLKQEGTPDYIVAKELQQLQQDLYGDKQVSTDKEAWQRALDQFTESIKDEPEEKKKKLLKKWHERNSQRRLKVVDGKVLLWKRIDDETKVLPVYEYKGDHGKKYEENNQEINKLLGLYRNKNTWNVDVTRMPDSVKARIRELEKENQKIARMAKRKNKKLRQIAKDRQKVFAKYAKWAATEEYLQLKKEIFKGVSEDMTDETYDMFLASTGTFYGPDMEQYRRFRWFNKIEVLPEYQEEFTELVPGDGFINTEENDSLKNEEYDRLSKSVGLPGEEVTMSMIPKASAQGGRYDNSKAYNKIFGRNGSQSLQALYKGVYDTIKESNEKNYELRYSDAYQLPQINGSFFKRLKRQGNKWHAAWEYVLDEVGWDGRLTPDDLDYGERIDHVLENLDELGQVSTNDSGTFNTKSVGTYGDGRRLNIVPQYYTRKLKDPSQISSDLLGITLEYFNSSLRYAHKNAIKDQCEAIIDMMHNREYYNEAASKKASKATGQDVVRSKPGSESNTYSMASKFVQMNLYNIRDTNKYTIAGTEINLGKVAALFRAATVAINLGCNIAVAGTGFLTASYTHIIQAMTGQHYTLKDAINGGNTVMWHLLMNIGGAKYIGDKLSKDKLMITMEYFNIADQGKRKYQHVNRNRAVNAVNDNWCFGMLTGLDFVIKSNIATSTLYSFHYYNGEFTTKEDILANMAGKSTQEVENALAEWEEGANLWSVIEPKDWAFNVQEQYKEAFEKVEHVVQSRISKYAEAADGMATETQKAAITTGWIGAAILTHRQYLPLMLQDRLFGEMVWDMDTQQYQGGVFRTGALFLLCMWDGIRAGSLAQGRSTYDKYFNDNSTVANSLKSRARRYQLRQILVEYATFKLLLAPLVSTLCAYADDDDQKDDKLLQLITYIMVRTRWEAFTPYRTDDIFNNLKTVSAQTGTLDKADALWNDAIKWVMPQGDLYNTFLRPHIKNRKEHNPVVQRGVYEGWYKAYRDAFKFLPQHNIYEQINGSKQKREYYTNQIEKLSN